MQNSLKWFMLLWTLCFLCLLALNKYLTSSDWVSLQNHSVWLSVFASFCIAMIQFFNFGNLKTPNFNLNSFSVQKKIRSEGKWFLFYIGLYGLVFYLPTVGLAELYEILSTDRISGFSTILPQKLFASGLSSIFLGVCYINTKTLPGAVRKKRN